MGVEIRERVTNKGISLYMDIYHRGNRWTKTTGLIITEKMIGTRDEKAVRREAETMAGREWEILSGGGPSHNAAKSRINLEDYMLILADRPEIVGHTRNVWLSTVSQLREFRYGKVQLGKVDKEWCEDFQKFLRNRLEDSSANLYMQKINAALNAAVTDRIIPHNSYEQVTRISLKKKHRPYLFPHDIERVIDAQVVTKSEKKRATIERVKNAFLFSVFTGLRFSDVQRLRWRNIVHMGYERVGLVFTTQKTQDADVQILHPALYPMLEKRGEPDSKVFDLPHHVTCNDYIRLVMEAAGVDRHISWHSSRRTFVMLLVEEKRSIIEIQSVVGHKHPSTTAKYIGELPTDKKSEIVNSIPNYFKTKLTRS